MESVRPSVAVPVLITRDRPDRPAFEVGLLAFLCFLPSLAAGFVYDDLLLIRDNPYAHGLSYVGRAFTHYFWQLDDRGSGWSLYYRPLVTVSYLVNWAIVGDRPSFYHLFNIVFHALTTVLVVVVARRWTGRTSLAVAVGALFALHPSRTESVIWIAGRTDVLMTFFLLGCVELSYRAARREGAARGRLIAASAVSFVAALLCKETSAMLPFMLAPDVAAADRESRRRFLPGFVIQTGMALLYVALRIFVFPVRPKDHLILTPKYGFLTIFAYLERVIWPLPQTFFYRPLVASHGNFIFPTPLVVGGVIAAVAYLGVTVVAFRRDRPAAILFVAAAAALGPLLNFTYTGIFVTTSDHFLYLPLFLFLSAIARLAREPLAVVAASPRARAAFVALLTFYGAVCTRRTFDYKDQDSIYLHELSINPDNPFVLKALSEESAKKGQIDQAFDLLLLASRPESRKYALLMPDWIDYQDYFRLLDLQVARTADGNLRDLEVIYRELNALIDDRPPPEVTRVGGLRVGRRVSRQAQADALQNRAREFLAAETALLASRLGDDARARRLLSMVNDDDDLEVLPNAQNVALTYARLGEFKAADAWLSAIGAKLPFRYPEEAIAAERRRLDRAEMFFRGARGEADDGQARLLRAEGFLELGAYLRSLRELKPLVDAGRDLPGIGPLYVDLLVAAGLDADATAVATRALGQARGEELVRDARDRLPPRLRALRKPTGPVVWWAQPLLGGPAQ